jgi:hypothetical protein
MIDTNKCEELLENGMQHRDLWELAEELLAEVKRLRKQLEDCKRQILVTADWIRDRGERTLAKELDEFLGWME